MIRRNCKKKQSKSGYSTAQAAIIVPFVLLFTAVLMICMTKISTKEQVLLDTTWMDSIKEADSARRKAEIINKYLFKR